MSEAPDPMIDVLMYTMLFENRETAALLLERLSQAGKKISRKPYDDDFEVTHHT